MADPVRVRRPTDQEGAAAPADHAPGQYEFGALSAREDFVIQTATTRPVKLGQPFTRWSLRKLVAYLRKVHGRVIRIGREALRCLLPATYHRSHGVRYFHGCYSVGDDTLWGVNRHRKGAANTLAALKSIRAARPDGAPHHRQLPPPQPPGAEPGPARLPAPAQGQRPPPRRPGRRTQRTRPHPQRERHPLGRTPPQNRGVNNPANLHGRGALIGRQVTAAGMRPQDAWPWDHRGAAAICPAGEGQRRLTRSRGLCATRVLRTAIRQGPTGPTARRDTAGP